MVSSNLSPHTCTKTATVTMQLSFFYMITFLLVTKWQCLLLSGDVELNPGPLDQEMIEKILLTVDNSTLDADDWNDVTFECSSLAPHWEDLCVFLRLPMGTSNAINEKYPDKELSCLNEALKLWILQKYKTEKYGPPTWKMLLNAIGKIDESLFRKLAKEHQDEAEKCEEDSVHAKSVPQVNLQKPEEMASNADSGFETGSIVSASSTSQLTKGFNEETTKSFIQLELKRNKGIHVLESHNVIKSNDTNGDQEYQDQPNLGIAESKNSSSAPSKDQTPADTTGDDDEVRSKEVLESHDEIKSNVTAPTLSDTDDDQEHQHHPKPTMMSHSQPPNFVAHLAHSKLLVPNKHAITKDYTVLTKVVGTGWQGKVLQCIHKSTGATRALKILRDVPKSRRAVDLQWRTCSHPNIVNITDIYENIFMGHRSVIIVMEYMKGGELFNRIQKKGHFTEREAAETVRSICLAVAHLHSLNIAHRDICPENLLFLDDSPSAVLKLGGFGFAKEATSGLRTPCYTPYYVAPEVLGPEMYDKSCDMWSVGVITYILLCGFPPFYSESGKPISPGMKKRICQGSYTFPDPEWTHISKEAKDLVKNLLKTNPQERLKVNEVLHHPWIANYDKLPETPLASSESELWADVEKELSHALATMRDQGEATTITLKDVATSKNPILARRAKKRAKEKT